MIICPQCGVELDEQMTVCPLCNSGMKGDSRPEVIPDESEDLQSQRMMSDYTSLTQIQKRKLFWELSGLILLSGILVTLIIDLVTSGSITWSRYSVTVCLVLFANVTLLSFWRHRLILLLGGSFLSTSLLLVLLDMYNEKIGWGTQLGVPLLLAFYIVVFLLGMVIKGSKHHGFNIIGFFFTAAGLFSLCIEGIVNRYVKGTIDFHWSLIVFVSMIPIASIFFFIHYRLKKGIELKRFFHI